jgi:hypothetical protein
MLTISEIINARKGLQKKPEDSELRQLPYKRAFIYGRVSSPAQIRDSRESIRESWSGWLKRTAIKPVSALRK